MQTNDVKPSFFDLNYPETINLSELKNIFKSKNENIKLITKEGLTILNGNDNTTRSQMDEKEKEEGNYIDIKTESSDDTISNNENKWGLTTQLYIGSITIVGLFILFRAMQKSKH
jgi:hypothetical protein